MIRMNGSDVPIAHRKWLDSKTFEDEPLYTSPDAPVTIPGHLNTTQYYIGLLVEDFPPSLREAWCRWTSAAALWHDLGKFSKEFQKRIRELSSSSESEGNHSAQKVDHSTAGAKLACQNWKNSIMPWGEMLAYAIAGHHGGLPNGPILFHKRFHEEIPEWKAYAPKELCDFTEMSPPFLWHEKSLTQNRCMGFAIAMQIRMLFSFLTDSDFLATEDFMSPERRDLRPRWPENILQSMRQKLESYLDKMECTPNATPIQLIRRDIHHRCLAQAKITPGIYQLNVPTGGGKTLSSLSFALAHACHHGLRRIIYVIPFTSIIDQTAREFRKVMASPDTEPEMECILEHHSNIAEEKDTERVRLMSENWDAPLIVTTNVQFFESLFSHKPSSCRKLHNIANSVIIFDEAQSLPSRLLAPYLEAMKTLEKDYGCTLVLCTATQPTLERKEEFPIGWESQELTSLLGAEFERHLENSMKRVEIRHLGSMDQGALVDNWKKLPDRSALFIVNTTKEAQCLFDAFSSRTSEHIVHLSARMHPAHREKVIKTVRKELEEGKNLILISTRVIEAGIDISFPVVYRAFAGVDSIAQAAGRCNRHGERQNKGLVLIYESTDFPIPPTLDDLLAAATATRDVLKLHPDADLLSPEMAKLFFWFYYNNRKDQTNQWDSKGIMEMTPFLQQPESIFKSFKFKDIDRNFKIIPDTSRSVMMVMNTAPEALDVWERLCKLDSLGLYPDRSLRRKIQRYSVQVYDNEWYILQNHGIQSYIDGTIHVLLEAQGLYDENKGLLTLKKDDPLYIGYIS